MKILSPSLICLLFLFLLQELKDLCSQLHHAADYCEKAFVKAEEKREFVFLYFSWYLRVLSQNFIHYNSKVTKLYFSRQWCTSSCRCSVVENTKEYLCRAVVTVVDHLGSVSAKLECQISTIDTASETKLRIDGLTQVSNFSLNFFILSVYVT